MATGFTRFENEVDTDDVPPATGPHGTQISPDNLPNYQDLYPQPDLCLVHPTLTGSSDLPLTPLSSPNRSGHTPIHPSAGLTAGQVNNASPPPYSILPPGGTPVFSSQPQPGTVDMNVRKREEAGDYEGYTRFENEEADIGTAETNQPSCPPPEQVDAPPLPASGPYTQSCLNDLPTYQGPQQLQPVANTEQPASTGVSDLPLKPLPSADESGQTPPHPSAGLPAEQDNAPPPPDSTLPSGGTLVITSQPRTQPVTRNMYALKKAGDYEGAKRVSRALRCVFFKVIVLVLACAIGYERFENEADTGTEETGQPSNSPSENRNDPPPQATASASAVSSPTDPSARQGCGPPTSAGCAPPTSAPTPPDDTSSPTGPLAGQGYAPPTIADAPPDDMSSPTGPLAGQGYAPPTIADAPPDDMSSPTGPLAGQGYAPPTIAAAPPDDMSSPNGNSAGQGYAPSTIAAAPPDDMSSPNGNSSRQGYAPPTRLSGPPVGVPPPPYTSHVGDTPITDRPPDYTPPISCTLGAYLAEGQPVWQGCGPIPTCEIPIHGPELRPNRVAHRRLRRGRRVSDDGTGISSYFGLAMAVLLICPPLGFVAMILSSVVDKRCRAGDLAGAKRSSVAVRVVSFCGVGLSITVGVLLIIFL
ncbi:extensin-like [Patiria miniata]|uniref:Uncharacterized protein n=1 Tax=Patiria miniata TaxID=46514 RepID=A0A913ZR93_PATMI|nr:extensin-like [Patiria miniata]